MPLNGEFRRLSGERQCESKVPCTRTQKNPQSGLELGLLVLESNALIMRPSSSLHSWRDFARESSCFCCKNSSWVAPPPLNRSRILQATQASHRQVGTHENSSIPYISNRNIWENYCSFKSTPFLSGDHCST